MLLQDMWQRKGCGDEYGAPGVGKLQQNGARRSRGQMRELEVRVAGAETREECSAAGGRNAKIKHSEPWLEITSNERE